MKILFVDDEPLIRESVPALMDWKKVGCTQLDIAENAYQALEMLQRVGYDLVITDIVMQQINGIELSKQIRAHYSQTKVIILSAYEDFAMARGAIEAGVSQYLLKPIVSEELEHAVLQVKQEISQRQQQQSAMQESEKIVDLYRHVLAERVWRELLDPTEELPASMHSMLEMAGLSNFQGTIACVLVGCPGVDREQMHRFALDSLSFMIGSAGLPDARYALVVTDACPTAELEQLRTRLTQASGQPAFVVCGRFVDDLLMLEESYKDACRKLILYGAMRLDSPLLQSEYERERKPDEELEHLLRDLRIAFVYGGKSLPRKLDSFYRHLRQHASEKAQALWESHLMLELHDLLRDKGIEVPPYAELMRDYAALPDTGQRKQMVIEIAARCSAGCEKENRPQVLVQSIKHYIEENFADPQLSVSSIANSFFISNAYLSRVFRRFCHQTCIEYITQVRMEQAQRLLENTEIRIADIAEKTGYSSVYYFSVQFKKLTGETPGEYRKRMRREDEGELYP